MEGQSEGHPDLPDLIAVALALPEGWSVAIEGNGQMTLLPPDETRSLRRLQYESAIDKAIRRRFERTDDSA